MERRVLRRGTVWLSESGPYAETPYHYSGEALRGEAGALHRFFGESVTGLKGETGETYKLDGETGETYIHDTYLLLCQLGDSAFARALSSESRPVRRQICSFLSRLFTDWHLSYPQTQAVLAL